MIYIWLCANGHECPVSDTQMRRSMVQPKCEWATGVVDHRIQRCGASLVRKLRPLNLGED